ncbi:Cullin binding-domain-containing protein, partial [Lineolata rhizophorae]
YYNGSSSTQQANTGLRNVLSKTFDHYREDPSNQPDTVGMMGMSKYLDELGVSIEDIGMLVVSEIVKCPSMGEMGRSGFVNGWTTQGAETIEKQRQVISRRRGNLGNGATFDVFKGIYKHTFAMAVQPPARAVPLENAVEFWRTLLSDDGWKWSTETTPWLDWWIEYLERDWKKSVNRDMWDQTLVFAQKARADEDMSFWDEMGAWPGVIDEFVSFVKEKREAGGPMEE